MSTCVKTFSLQVTTGQTPCNLNTPGSGIIGNVVPPIAGGTTNWGTFPAGEYAIKYLRGALQSSDNPCPSPLWKFLNYFALWNSGGNSFNWMDGQGSECAGTQAGVEVLVRAFMETLTITDHAGGTIGMQCLGVGANPVNGTPSPTFQLTQIVTYPTEPARVRIKSFNAALFTSCPGEPVSANPAWDGTFPQFTGDPLAPFYTWDQAGGVNTLSFKGQNMAFAEVAYVADGSAPSSTGCGWSVEITLTNKDSWFGYKLTGTDPTGVYNRSALDPNGHPVCSPGPATLTIESF